MKSLLLVFCLVSGYAAAAKVVSFNCAAKVYGCHNGHNGVKCFWDTFEAQDYELPMRESQNASGAPLYTARFQDSIDNHLLTLNIAWIEGQILQPLYLRAKLDAGSVVSETTGSDKIDVSLRNDRFGRGYTCWNFQVND